MNQSCRLAVATLIAAVTCAVAVSHADPSDPDDQPEPTHRTLDAFLAISAANAKALDEAGLKKAIAEATRFPHSDSDEGSVDLGECLLLHGVRSITADEAGQLANFDGAGMMLPDLERLDAATAEQLAGWGPGSANYLALDGLTSLSADVAKQLVTWYGEHLSLNGLTALEADAAEMLANRMGFSLSLCGLTELDADAARALSKWNGTWYMGALVLDGLATISADVAAALAEFGGITIHLNGIETLDDAAADALERWHANMDKTVFGNETVMTALAEAADRRADGEGDSNE